jgi:L-lactate dehydrogenase (cytochrome)
MMQPIADIADLRDAAKRKMPRPIFDWIEGGSFNEQTARFNCSDFSKLLFRQRAFVDVSNRSARSVLLGQETSLPIAISPTGLSGVICAKGGEIIPARAAKAEGIPYCLPMLSVYPLEEVVEAVGPVWLQIAMLKRRELIENLIERAKSAGCPVLVMTATMPVGSRLNRSIYNGLTALPPPLRPAMILEYSKKPGWWWQILTGRRIGLGNFEGAFTAGNELTEVVGQFDDSADWESLEWVRKLWPGKLMVKGIVNARDAKMAIERGVDAVSVSNHGGIQLDGAPSTIATLSAVADAVGKRAEVFLDGGVRSGQDVLRAIALGARGCLIGRAHLYGMAADGEQGVRKAIQIMREEINITMALTGKNSLMEPIDDMVYRQEEPAALPSDSACGF